MTTLALNSKLDLPEQNPSHDKAPIIPNEVLSAYKGPPLWSQLLYQGHYVVHFPIAPAQEVWKGMESTMRPS